MFWRLVGCAAEAADEQRNKEKINIAYLPVEYKVHEIWEMVGIGKNKVTAIEYEKAANRAREFLAAIIRRDTD